MRQSHRRVSQRAGSRHSSKVDNKPDSKVDSKPDSARYQKLDMTLYFDLEDIAETIIETTHDKQTIVLVGHTPSYLGVFLEAERTVFNLPFSGKIYWMVDRQGKPDKSICDILCAKHHSIDKSHIPLDPSDPLLSIEHKQYAEKIATTINDLAKNAETKAHMNAEYGWPSYLPSREAEQAYFDYLDKSTMLTRKYVSANWHDIVLVDYSTGRTIHGVSVFFNRYIGNLSGAIPCDACDISGAKPLQFINIGARPQHIKSHVNIDPVVYGLYGLDKAGYNNFNPSLIIYTGHCGFVHLEDMIVRDTYPRVTPSYGAWIWQSDPYKSYDISKGLALIEHIKQVRGLIRTFKQNKGDARKLFDMVKAMRYVPDDFKKLDPTNLDIAKELDSLFRHTYDWVARLKSSMG